MKNRNSGQKRRSISILLLLFTLFCFPLPTSAWEGLVVEIPDARTLVLEQEGKQRKISLYGLRTPDLNEPFGEAALEFFRDLLKEQQVTIQPVRSGTRGALVFLPGDSESVNAKLLREGWAWLQEAYCEQAALCGRLNAVQTQAERSKNGIWSKIPENMPPWRWLKEHK